MQEALSCTSFINDPLYEEMVQQTAHNCRPPMRPLFHIDGRYIRHCDADGKVIHISNGRNLLCARKECTTEYELHLFDNIDFSLLTIPEGKAVAIPKHVVPILGGYCADGRRALVPLFCNRHLVIESDSFEDKVWEVFSDEQNKPLMLGLSLTPIVLCLRFDLDTYPRRFGPDDFMRNEAAGIDATGPYSWRFTRYIPHSEPEESTYAADAI